MSGDSIIKLGEYLKAKGVDFEVFKDYANLKSSIEIIEKVYNHFMEMGIDIKSEFNKTVDGEKLNYLGMLAGGIGFEGKKRRELAVNMFEIFSREDTIQESIQESYSTAEIPVNETKNKLF